MKATQLLHDLGQSLWLDNITRDILEDGTLKRYIDELSVTGLTSNPTIFDHAIKNSSAYDGSIRDALAKGKAEEELFFDLALDDITRAADLFRAIYDRTNTVDGWTSLEVSPRSARVSGMSAGATTVWRSACMTTSRAPSAVRPVAAAASATSAFGVAPRPSWPRSSGPKSSSPRRLTTMKQPLLSATSTASLMPLSTDWRMRASWRWAASDWASSAARLSASARCCETRSSFASR